MTAPNDETPDWLPVVTEVNDGGEFIQFHMSIPKSGADKLRQIQEFTGLKSLEDTLKFLLACTAERLHASGYTFDPEDRTNGSR